MYAVCEFESIEVQYSDYTDKKADYADDGNLLDSEYSAESLDLKAKYVYANGMLLAKYETSPADTHYYHHDGLGSVIGMTNEAGFVEQSYFYDDFGNSLGSWGNVDNHYLYTGQEYDDEISGAELYNLRARYYDSGVGRFVSEDPVNRVSKGTIATNPNELNAYLYVQNNPVNQVDPLGLKALKHCTPAEVMEEMSLITVAFKRCCEPTWPWQIDCAKKAQQIIYCMDAIVRGEVECCYIDYVMLLLIPYHVGVGVQCFDCCGKRYVKKWEPWSCRKWP